MRPTFGSLFSGIGGIDLGLERAGWKCEWQVEIDGYCTRVLERHWPDVARFRDVRDCHGTLAVAYAECEPWTTKRGQRTALAAEDIGRTDDGRASSGDVTRGQESALCSGQDSGHLPYVDLICGGFPCQPVSHAGKRKGDADERWLWPQFARIVREVRPRWALIENVPGLLSIDAGRLFRGVLWDLAQAGYDAEWFTLSAADVGAPHLRERVWILADSNDGGRGSEHGQQQANGATFTASGSTGDVAHADGERRDGWSGFNGQGWRGELANSDWWTVEPDVVRVAHGVPARVDRLRGLGNAVVPQVAEVIGRMIWEREHGVEGAALVEAGQGHLWQGDEP